jgi:hypothetical protein
MNKIAEGYIIVGFIIVCAIAVLGGTILWLIWEDSLTAMFPKAVESGVLAEKLGWWQSVKITWIFALLIKSTNTTSSKKD